MPARPHSLRSLCVLLLLSSACSRELTLPDVPQRGKVSGRVDTASHIPQAGNDVYLVAEDGSRALQRTAADGAFVFADVVPGLYYVDVALPGFAPLLRPNVKLAGGQELDLGTLSPTWLQGTPSEATVTGKVVAAGGGETAGGQVEFLLEPLSQRVALAPIGLSGVFVQRVPPGQYTLRASHPLYVTGEVSGVVVGEAEQKDLSAQPLSLALDPATIAGTVLRERDQQTAAPADGVLVTLGTGATTTTDAQGRFLLQGLPAGAHTVRFALAGHSDEASGHAVTLSPGKTATLPTLTLKLDRGSIKGTVVIADNQIARDVTVVVTGTPYNALVTPSVAEPWKGSFLISGVPAGVYEVSASKARYSRGSASSVTVTGNGTVDVGSLTLTVLQGDFVIEDPDTSNTAGYTRTPSVTLNLTGFTGAQSFRASEDATFTNVGYQSFTGTSQPFTLAAAQGTHTVYTQYLDSTGTPSPVFSSSIVLDSVAPTAPTLVVNGGAAFTSSAQQLVLTLSALENIPAGVDAVSGLAHVRVAATAAVDGQGQLTSPRQSYQRDLAFVRPVSTDGVQAVYAQFIDHAGNASSVVTASIVVDTVAPAGGIALAKGLKATVSGYTQTALVDLNETAGAEPNGGHVLIKLANTQADLSLAVLQPVKATAAWFLDPSADGLKTVYAVLTDAAGNSSAVLSATITYDTTAPSPVSAVLLSAATTSSTTVHVDLAAIDASGLSPTQGVTLSEDPFFLATGTVGPLPMTGNGEFDFAVSGTDGPKQVYVRFRDVAGNESSASVQVLLDTEAPTGAMTLQGTLADGTVSSSITNVPNIALLLTQSGATSYAVGDETLLSCSQVGALYKPLTVQTIPHLLTGSASPRQVHLCLRDAAGNTSAMLSAAITLDSTPPGSCPIQLVGTRVDGTVASTTKTGTTSIQVNLTCVDAPAEIFLASAPVSCTALASLAWQPYRSTLAYTLPGPDGPNTVYACARDLAHNVGTLGQAVIQLDTLPPSNPQLVINGGAAYVNSYQVADAGYVASVTGSAVGATEWALSEGSTFAYAALPPSTKNFTFGGSGPRQLSAVFRDDVGNESSVVTTTLNFDVTAPDVSASTPLLLSPTNNGYTNTVDIGVRMTSPVDATGVQLARAANVGACADTDFAVIPTPPLIPVAAQYAFTLAAGEGNKRVCARFLDAAGNRSTLVSATIILDTTPPTAPEITTAPKVVNAADNSTYDVLIQGPVVETNFARYETLGGKINAWTSAGTVNPQPSNRFTFNLKSNALDEDGVPNVLRVRAVDLAGNVGPEDSVLITTDISAPRAIVLSTGWVSNSDQQGVVYWTASPSPDVKAYRVYYGTAQATYNGTFANQGASPITVGLVSAVTLSGLINASPTYVTVRPVDFADNEGPSPSGVAEVIVQSNVLSPNFISSLTLAMSRVAQLVVHGNTLYAVGSQGGCGTGNAVVQPVDISRLVSPVQGGVPLTNPAGPLLSPALSYADALDCASLNDNGVSLAVDGDYGFLASGTKLRILDLSLPLTPALLATIDLGPTVFHGVAVKGSTLVLGGRQNIIVFDLSKLYDGLATLPTASDVIGIADGGTAQPSGIAWTRSRLIQLQSGGNGNVHYYDLTDALDGDAGTVFNGADKTGSTFGVCAASIGPIISGNYLYSSETARFTVFDLNDPLPDGGTFFNTGILTRADNVLSETGGSSPGQYDVAGSQVFLNDGVSTALRSIDLSIASSPLETGMTRYTGGAGSALVTFGNYIFVGTSSGSLYTLETATPRSLHTVVTGTFGGPKAEISGGFLISSTRVMDLQSGLPLTDSAGSNATYCVYDSARFEDTQVSSKGNLLQVSHLEDALDRNPATVVDGAEVYDVTLAAGTRAMGLEPYGNFLVASEERADGTWVEVFDATKVRDLRASTLLAASDSKGSFRVTTNVGRSELTVHQGRAFVTLEGTGHGLYIVDLRPLLDSDPATALTASHYQGFAAATLPAVGSPSARETVVRGNYAYVASSAGLEIIDVSAAMDENLGTTVSSPARALLSIPGAQGVAVYGSYALVVPLGGGYIASVDVSSPLLPRLIGSLPFAKSSTSCGMGGAEGNVPMRAGIAVSGSRAYVTAFQATYILELE